MVQTLEHPETKSRSVLQPDVPVLPEEFGTGAQYKNEILILISAPLLNEDFEPQEDLAIQKEVDRIIDILNDLPIKIEVEINVKIATTESIIEAFSNRLNPLIIHFIGHGMMIEEETALVLENPVGIARPCSAMELRNLLGTRVKPPSQVALLSACRSEGLARELLSAGVAHVVAVNAADQILDISAPCFARTFYAALFSGKSVQSAYEQGQSAMMVDDKLKEEN